MAATGVSLAFANWAARPAAPSRALRGLAGTGRTRVGRRGLGASYALALGAVAVIMTATDAFTALFAWEALTVAFYLLAGFERGRRGRPDDHDYLEGLVTGVARKPVKQSSYNAAFVMRGNDNG